ncbi:TPA: hypothetical protein ACXNW8_001326 [Clostridium botulinum]|uniref:hypothetical protein n=1 Tax=Clostridium botulinum TaxID=1491 RepID=UPI001C9A5163|nr:hypothetical protein [Clostridium botulinum]MBY6909528.1 hypothetical protein [Clostridium botulinum]
MLEELITIKEVINAINYSIEGDKIIKKKLDYYRINIAEDSRYTFKVMFEDLKELCIVVVKYKKEIYKLRYDKKLKEVIEW